MTALADRLEQILALREMSARELGRRAGLDESHVGTLIRAEPEKQEKVQLLTLKRLASAAGVRLAWLTANDGSMLEPGQPDPGRFSSRLAQMLRERGMEASALDAAIGKKPGFTTRAWLRAQMRTLPNDEDVMAASKALRCSFEWLRYGLGTPHDPAPKAETTALEAPLRLSVTEPETRDAILQKERAFKPAPRKKMSATQRAKRRWSKRKEPAR